MGNITVIGDLNVRVGMKQETIMTINDHTEMLIPVFFLNFDLAKPNSEDKTTCSRGRKLLQHVTKYELF